MNHLQHIHLHDAVRLGFNKFIEMDRLPMEPILPELISMMLMIIFHGTNHIHRSHRKRCYYPPNTGLDQQAIS